MEEKKKEESEVLEETKELKQDISDLQKDIEEIQENVKDVKKKGSFQSVLLTLVVLILFVAFALYGFASGVGYGIGKVKEVKNAEKSSETVSNNDTIHAYYYETKQTGSEKYFLILGNMSNDDSNGYFTIRYVSVFETGSEAPLASGYYTIKDNTLKLSVGPYTKTDNEKNTYSVTETVFKKLGAGLTIDPEEDYRKNTNPSYYKMNSTDYNEDEITIGTQKFYKVG